MGADLYFMRDEFHAEDMKKKNAEIVRLEDCLLQSIALLDIFVRLCHKGKDTEDYEWNGRLEECEKYLKTSKCWGK